MSVVVVYRDGSSETFTEVTHFDATGMKVEQYEATSKDGTKIPYFIFMPKDYTANGANPTVLYCYGGFEVSMRDLAARIGHLTGYRGDIVWDAARPNGQPRRMLDVQRAREHFGFEARTGFDDGLARTIAWYRANREAIAAREPGSRPGIVISAPWSTRP